MKSAENWPLHVMIIIPELLDLGKWLILQMKATIKFYSNYGKKLAYRHSCLLFSAFCWCQNLLTQFPQNDHKITSKCGGDVAFYQNLCNVWILKVNGVKPIYKKTLLPKNWERVIMTPSTPPPITTSGLNRVKNQELQFTSLIN